MYNLSNLSNNKTGDSMLENIMSKDIIWAKEDSSIQEIADKMLTFGIGFLPITNKNKVVGVITDRDIATTVFKNTTSLSHPIQDYIHKNIISCDKNTNLIDVLHLMKKEKVKRVLVTENKKVVGIVSLSDIIKNSDETEEIISALKEIFALNRNTDKYPTEIDEFYL